jgi:hypothetical protein
MLGACSATIPPKDGCTDTGPREQARALASASLLTAHPPKAEPQPITWGCGASDDLPSAGREYIWPHLSAADVITFYRAAAVSDGWTEDKSAASGPANTLGSTLCFHRKAGATLMLFKLYFSSTSETAAYGDVYETDIWTAATGETTC